MVWRRMTIRIKQMALLKSRMVKQGNSAVEGIGGKKVIQVLRVKAKVGKVVAVGEVKVQVTQMECPKTKQRMMTLRKRKGLMLTIECQRETKIRLTMKERFPPLHPPSNRKPVLSSVSEQP